MQIGTTCYAWIHQGDALEEQTVDYYALLLFSISGMLFLVGSTDLISIYFSLELMALCIYILVAYLRDLASSRGFRQAFRSRKAVDEAPPP